MKRIEDSLRDIWDNTECTNIQIIGVPGEEEKKKGSENIFEEIIVDNFPNMGKEIVNQVQEVQRVPYRINPRRNMPRHILIKLSKINFKEKILKAARENQQITYKEIPIRLTADLSAGTLQARREWQDIFKLMKGKKNYNQDCSTQQRFHSYSMEKLNIYRQAKVKKIQHHQTSFTTNAKGTSLGRKYKRMKRSTITNPKQLRKW